MFSPNSPLGPIVLQILQVDPLPPLGLPLDLAGTLVSHPHDAQDDLVTSRGVFLFTICSIVPTPPLVSFPQQTVAVR